jgi:hypothetical protein
VIFQKVLLQLVFWCVARYFHVVAWNGAEERQIVLAGIVLSLFSSAKTLVIVKTVYSRAFKPVIAINCWTNFHQILTVEGFVFAPKSTWSGWSSAIKGKP